MVLNTNNCLWPHYFSSTRRPYFYFPPIERHVISFSNHRSVDPLSPLCPTSLLPLFHSIPLTHPWSLSLPLILLPPVSFPLSFPPGPRPPLSLLLLWQLPRLSPSRRPLTLGSASPITTLASGSFFLPSWPLPPRPAVGSGVRPASQRSTLALTSRLPWLRPSSRSSPPWFSEAGAG